MMATLYDVGLPTINEHIKKIYADNELIYSSNMIQATKEKIHFKVQVGNARFIKIKMCPKNPGYNWYGSYYLLGNAYLYN